MDVKRSSSTGVVCVCVALVLLRSVCCISVTAPAAVSAVRGSSVTLSCSFSSSSSVTSAMSVDWSFRPERSSGPAHTFFHFSSQAYPPLEDYFKDRVKWLGSPSGGDASIQLLNASLTDNGTYTCAVRNPPDVQGSPAQTVLSVTPQRVSLAFTDVGVLLVFVLVPSGIVTLLLLGRILCPCSSERPSPAAPQHSPIEELTGEEYYYNTQKKSSMCCCYFKDYEYEDDYMQEKPHELTFTESQC